MRILFAHSTADLYGASRSLLRLTGKLKRDGEDVIVVLPSRGPLQEALEQQGIAVWVMASLAVVERRAFDVFGLVRLLWNTGVSTIRILLLMRVYKVDLVHTNTSLILSAAIAAKISGAHHVWHIRESFEEFPGLWRLYQHYMDWFSDAIVAVSEAVAGQYSERIRERKVCVIHNGFPREEFQEVSAARTAEFRRQFGLNRGPLVGLIGRIKLRRKGQDVLVRAVAELNGGYDDAKFLLIGSPFPGNEEHLSRLFSMMGRLGVADRFVYTGEVKDIKAAYAALDFTVLPAAVPEPFGGVVIESMAMGKPVIGTRLGGTVEQIEHEVTGLLVEPNDPTELAGAIERLIVDAELRARMGKQGKERFLSRFEFGPFYQRILQLYSRLLED